ncbi:MAG TPA: diguanylate cyclase, partial [Rectinemataceae bacterium]|nr:diguanylate cyclase [Rectinemataceae bacterium]
PGVMRDSLLRDMLDAVSEGVYFVDLERRITYWNSGAERITGFRAEEVIGSRCSDNILRHVDEAGKELCAGDCPLSIAMASGAKQQANVFLHHRDGHRVPVAVRGIPYFDEKEAAVGAIEVFTDRSERLAILAELQELRKENLSDSLTGLGNRRYFDIRLEPLLAALRGGGGPFGLLLIDIDHFKQMNDDYGHATGDRILRMVAWTLANAVRRGDVSVRWGGDEFVVLAPKATPMVLGALAERIRALVASGWLSLDGGRSVSVTVSVGGAISAAGDDSDALVRRADLLLYRSKEGGRNRATIEGEPMGATTGAATTGAAEEAVPESGGGGMLELGAVQETLMMPLWGRAHETRKALPLLRDEAAAAIVEGIDYDFTRIAKRVNPLSRAGWIARAIYFDEAIRSFLREHERAAVVNLGCGLDTSFDRVDDGKAHWYELDLPDVIDLRRRFIAEVERRVFIADSALGSAWYDRIEKGSSVLILIAGVIYYFEEAELRCLFREIRRRLGRAELIFDYASKRGMRAANRSVIGKAGMGDEARLKWGIDELRELEAWDCGLRILDDRPIFRDHRKRYPPSRRLGMALSDALGIMSLARIEIA